MVRKQNLKVFRTAIGFDDAYVAAPSQKAALAAWGVESNLFGLGMAEVITDPELIREPLAAPGTVIRRRRGDLAQHLAAASRTPKRRAKSAAPAEEAPVGSRRAVRSADKRATGATEPGTKPHPKLKAKPPPPPTRARVAEAEAELAAFESQSETELADLRKREEALRKERQGIEKRQHAERVELQRRAEREKEEYDRALERWLAKN